MGLGLVEERESPGERRSCWNVVDREVRQVLVDGVGKVEVRVEIPCFSGQLDGSLSSPCFVSAGWRVVAV